MASRSRAASRLVRRAASRLAHLATVVPVNLLTHSQAFDLWTMNAASVAANTVTAPDGGKSADMVTATATGGASAVSSNAPTISPSTEYTASVYVLPGGTAAFAYIQLNVFDGATSAAFISLNRATGAVSASQLLVGTLNLTGKAEAVPGGGWRLEVSFTGSATASQAQAYIGPCDGALSRNVTLNDSVPLWQAQLVKGSAPGAVAYTA